MALNIKNQGVEQLLQDIVTLTGETKTEAVRNALAARQRRLIFRFVTAKSNNRFYAFLEDEVWQKVPPEQFGVALTKEEEEHILGYGEFGV
jgi:hypothetical protein